MIDDVVNFNKIVLGIPSRLYVDILDHDTHHISLLSLNEELMEYVQAYAKGDVVGSIDSIIDLIYFAIGVLYKHGLEAEDIKNIFAIVHEANMKKVAGRNAKRDTGAVDAVKPNGWVAPEISIRKYLESR